MNSFNPFLHKGIGLIDLVMPRRRWIVASTLAKIATELALIAGVACLVFLLVALAAGMGVLRGAEVAAAISAVLLSIQPFCSFCYFAWRRDKRYPRIWPLIMGFLAHDLFFLCLMAPRLVIVRVTEDVLMIRIPHMMGGVSGLWALSVAVGVLVWIAAHYWVVDANALDRPGPSYLR